MDPLPVSVSQVDWLQENWMKLVASNSSLGSEVRSLKLQLAGTQEEEQRLKSSLRVTQSQLNEVSVHFTSGMLLSLVTYRNL